MVLEGCRHGTSRRSLDEAARSRGVQPQAHSARRDDLEDLEWELMWAKWLHLKTGRRPGSELSADMRNDPSNVICSIGADCGLAHC
jgi:hypothetical protein